MILASHVLICKSSEILTKTHGGSSDKIDRGIPRAQGRQKDNFRKPTESCIATPEQENGPSKSPPKATRWPITVKDENAKGSTQKRLGVGGNSSIRLQRTNISLGQELRKVLAARRPKVKAKKNPQMIGKPAKTRIYRP